MGSVHVDLLLLFNLVTREPLLGLADHGYLQTVAIRKGDGLVSDRPERRPGGLSATCNDTQKLYLELSQLYAL